MAVMLDAAAQMAFGDGVGLRDFFLVHRLSHAAIASAIVAAGGAAVPGFDVGDERARQQWDVLMQRKGDAPPTRALRDWLTLHSQLHQAEFNAVGFGLAPNMIDVNFADPDAFAGWMQDHQYMHDVVGNALGIA